MLMRGFRIKEKRLTSVIFAASLIAFVGIAAIQYYYVRAYVEAYEATFERNVNDAMSRVIYQLEKKEIAQQLKEKLKKYKGSHIINTVDSLNLSMFKELEKMGIDSMGSDSIINITRERIRIQVATNRYGEYIRKIDTNIISLEKVEEDSSNTNDSGSEFIRTMDLTQGERFVDVFEHARGWKPIRKQGIPGKIDSVYDNVDQFLKRTFIISDVMEDFFNINHYIPIEERVNISAIDSLIREEFEILNITASYEFGIYSPSRHELVLEKTGQYSTELVNNGVGFRLYPSDMFSPPEYLMIYFPNRKNYIYSELTGMFSLSMVLILAVAFSFFFILFNLLRQKKLSEMKTDFINNMTHEIKTPISTISLACEALNMPETSMDEQSRQSFIHIIEQENKRLAAMTEKILQTAIIEKKTMSLKREMVDVHELIMSAVTNVNHWVKQKGGQVLLELLAENPKAMADKIHFENAIYNLLDNANKYSPHSPLIKVSTRNENGTILISISDNGIGISKLDHKKIFEKLYRVSTGNIHSTKGFGLGLNYTKAIVDGHGGKIIVESEQGKGSTFTIKIPTYHGKK